MESQKFWLEYDDNIRLLLTNAVGFPVNIYAGVAAANKIEYQIMPATEADCERFWDWHLENNEQWFNDPITASAEFLKQYRRFYSEASGELVN